MDVLIKIFALFGAATIAVIVYGIVTSICETVKCKISEAKYYYHRTHLYGKKVKAECYCECCKHYNKDDGFSGSCEYSATPVGPECYCWRAYPITREEWKKRLKEDKL